MKSNSAWTLREMVALSAMGVVFGFLYLLWVQFWLVLQGLIGPLSMDIVFGFWFCASTFAAWVIRKPWAAFLVSMAAVATELMAGSPSGAIMLLTGFVQGLGSEVPFLLTRWKKYNWTVILLSGAAASLFSFGYTWIRFGYWKLDPGLLVTMFILRTLSGIILGGALGRVMAEGVRRTGVFRGLAVDPPE